MMCSCVHVLNCKQHQDMGRQLQFLTFAETLSLSSKCCQVCYENTVPYFCLFHLNNILVHHICIGWNNVLIIIYLINSYRKVNRMSFVFLFTKSVSSGIPSINVVVPSYKSRILVFLISQCVYVCLKNNKYNFNSLKFCFHYPLSPFWF